MSEGEITLDTLGERNEEYFLRMAHSGEAAYELFEKDRLNYPRQGTLETIGEEPNGE